MSIDYEYLYLLTYFQNFLTLYTWRIGAVYPFDFSVLWLYFLYASFAFLRASSVIKVSFINWIFSRYFQYWTHLQKSGGSNFFREVSEVSMAIRELNESSTGVGNRFWELVTAEQDTQNRSILGGAISIGVIFRWYLKSRTNIQALYGGWKHKYPLTQKQIHQHPRKWVLMYVFQVNPWGAPYDTEWFYKL